MKTPLINRVKIHWSVYAFLISSAAALYFLASIFLMVKLDVILLFTYIYLTGFFYFIAFLTKPIRPPKHFSALEQEAFVNEAIESKFDIIEGNKFNLCVISALVVIIWGLKLL